MQAADRFPRFRLGAAFACLVAASSGCSFVFSDGPPAHVPPDFKCKESYAPPIVDTVLASAGLAATLWLNAVAGALGTSGNAESDCSA